MGTRCCFLLNFRTWGMYKFRDYCPRAFASIREFYGISSADFLVPRFISQLTSRNHGNYRKKRVRFDITSTNCIGLEESTARSGSMFYKTPDKKYFFKTMLRPEVDTMQELLKDYCDVSCPLNSFYPQHLHRHPSTFLVQIFGMMRIRIGAWKCWIQIMGNTFPPDVSLDAIYDLKASLNEIQHLLTRVENLNLEKALMRGESFLKVPEKTMK